MSDRPIFSSLPRGYRLDEGRRRPDNFFGDVRDLEEATEANITACRRWWLERHIDDFETSGKNWTDRVTREQYRVAGDRPLMALNPADERVAAFVRVDNCLLFLRKQGDVKVETSVAMGTMLGSKADDRTPIVGTETGIF
jgi:hypothetical protein